MYNLGKHPHYDEKIKIQEVKVDKVNSHDSKKSRSSHLHSNCHYQNIHKKHDSIKSDCVIRKSPLQTKPAKVINLKQTLSKIPDLLHNDEFLILLIIFLLIHEGTGDIILIILLLYLIIPQNSPILNLFNILKLKRN